MKKICYIGVAVLLSMFCEAQTFTLKQCVETGIKSNLDVQQSDLQMQVSKVNWSQARLNMLPDLNGSVNHGINYGRNIDPTSNDYVNQKIKFANYNLNSGIVLFNGFYIQQTIQQTALMYEANRLDLQQVKDNITLNVVLAYLQVLSREDLLVQAQNQLELSQKQVQRLEVLNNDGAIRPSDLYDLKGQLSGDQISVANAQNALETAKISLCDIMNIPYSKTMKLERMDPALFVLTYNDSPQQIYDKALGQFPLIRSAALKTKSAEKAVKANRGLLFPQLSLNGNSSSNYSSLAPDKYGPQLKDNFSTTIALSVQIPIFNAWQTRNRIKLAKITLKGYSIVEEASKTLLQRNIERAHVNMTSTFDQYKALLNQVNFYRESFHAAEIRFNEGVGTPIDYLTAKNNLDRANSNFIISKYDYLLRTKILDYYQGAVTW